MIDDAVGLESDNAKFQQYRTAYDQACKYAKAVEEFRGSVVIPAHNELRYAGHHLLKAMAASGEDLREEELLKGIRHCERAMYEAPEAGISFAIKYIVKFKDDFRDADIAEAVPEWGSYLVAVKEAQGTLIAGRGQFQSLFEAAACYVKHFEMLRDICADLDIGRNKLNAIYRRERSDWRRFFIQVGAFFIAALVSSSIVATAIIMTAGC